MLKFGLPLNLSKWIEEHRSLLKPPVGNRTIWENGEYIVMIVAGPNSRKDYHYNEGPEFFYQLEGDITVRVQDEGKPVDVHIKEGEIFLLPAKVPHSPQRPANTIGLVIESKREANDTDGLQFYCDNCNTKIYEEYFHLENIVTQFGPIFEKVWGSEELRTCKTCNAVLQPPQKVVPLTE